MCVVYSQKESSFIVTYGQVQWPNIAVLKPGSGSGNSLLAMLEISPFPTNIHTYPVKQSIPEAIITAQKQMSY